MIRLTDGRKNPFQWDTGVEIESSNPCNEFHFSNKAYGRTVDVAAVENKAKIPDFLLQSAADLSCYVFFGDELNGYTKETVVFTVEPRNKPSDYVFTPTEQITLQKIVDEIGELNSLTTQDKTSIVNAINEVAAGGGSGGVSKSYVDAQDDEMLMDAMEYADNQITLIPAWAKEPVKPKYTASEVGALPSDTVIPNVPEWALEPNKPTYTAKEVNALPDSTPIPTKTSDLQNDSGFLTEHQSLAEYAKKTELPTKTSELTNDSGFLTAPYGIETESADAHEIKANVFCEFTGNHANVNITLAPADGYAEYNFSFVAAPSGCNLSIPASVVWDGGKAPTLEANKKYEVSIFGNVAVISQGAVIA